MSALSEFQETNEVTRALGIDLSFLARLFWKWFRDHRELQIVERKVLIFTIRIRVRDLAPLFVQLFGPAPGTEGITNA